MMDTEDKVKMTDDMKETLSEIMGNLSKVKIAEDSTEQFVLFRHTGDDFYTLSCCNIPAD